ncbi:ribosomal RNA processing protein 1 homolog [Diorhabda sublineata]|uniref:ribosomal RNA processing protein 1 homolog n=1 Tax=Diorhabda sublineata TaxID=1163346 RepID=UPI0024E13AB8|nr:ribosomal RNA processing protein 1 homolog [Diorhabda sublineata]
MVNTEFEFKNVKIMKPETKPDSKSHIILQESDIIKILAGNDPKARDKALKNLNKWFLQRSKKMPYTESDFERIWKGLFYCMWMSDKPLIQEECAEKISKLVHFPDLPTSILFFKAGMYILGSEWSSIDQLRLDKFLMLVRRLLRQILRALQQHSFTDKNVQRFNDAILETVLNKNKTPVGLFMHFNEIFMEELAKVTQGKLHNHSVVVFLKPFIQRLATSQDGREIKHIRKYIFSYLMRQSDVGLDYQEKYEAWKRQGFPGSINSMQKITIEEKHSDDEEENSSTEEQMEKPLDPRAGRVDVEIPQIRFNAKEVSNALLEFKFDKKSSTHSRNIITVLARQFNKLSQGYYPLGIKKIDVKDKHEDINVRKAANRLIKFEKKLLGKNRKRKLDKENNEQGNIEKRLKLQEEISDVLRNEGTKTNSENLLTVKSKKKKEKKTKVKVHKEEESKTLAEHNDNQVEEIVEKAKKKKDKLNKLRSDSIMQTVITKKNQNGSLNSIDSKINSQIIKAKNKLKYQKDKKINEKRKKGISSKIDCVFKRNSGTWVVYEAENNSLSQKTVDCITPNKLSGKNTKSVVKANTGKSRTIETNLSNFICNDDSPKSGLAPVNLNESSPEQKEVFQKSDWEEPLQEGEYEICIPSKKYIGKMKKLAKNENKSVNELINSTLERIKGKSRLSLDSRLVNNPFSKSPSAKKVKINIKLNRSQDIYEHIANVRSSPAIPYDATKKPSKPLLKPSANSTPINPFYKKLLLM